MAPPPAACHTRVLPRLSSTYHFAEGIVQLTYSVGTGQQRLQIEVPEHGPLQTAGFHCASCCIRATLIQRAHACVIAPPFSCSTATWPARCCCGSNPDRTACCTAGVLGVWVLVGFDSCARASSSACATTCTLQGPELAQKSAVAVHSGFISHQSPRAVMSPMARAALHLVHEAGSRDTKIDRMHQIDGARAFQLRHETLHL